MAELGRRFPQCPRSGPRSPSVPGTERGFGPNCWWMEGSESLVNALQSLGTPIFGSEARGPGASCLGSLVLPVAVKVLGRVLRKTSCDRREK